MEQVAVRCVKLDDIEPRGMRAPGGLAVSIEQHVQVALLERARRDPSLVERRFGGRDGAPRRLAAVEIGLRERPVAVPGPRHARLPSRVGKLDGRHGALIFYESRNSLER